MTPATVWTVILVKSNNGHGWAAVLRGGGQEQQQYGPEIDAVGLLSLIAEDLDGVAACSATDAE